MLPRTSGEIPKLRIQKCFAVTWWFTCIIVGASYSGNLMAGLTVRRTTLPFDTLEEMVTQNTMKFGMTGGASNIEAFQVQFVLRTSIHIDCSRVFSR